MKFYKLLFILIITVTSAVSFAADQIHWTITGQNSVTVDWHGTSSESTIRYGTSSGNLTNEVTAVHPSPLPSSPGSFWEARITGLAENTLYYYAIENGPEHNFRTPPVRGSSDFIVYAEGDIGSTTNMRTIQGLMATDLPRFVLMLGDLTYGDSNGLTIVERHYNDVLVWSQDAAYMYALGNHDWSSSSSDLAQLNEYEGRFDFPNSQTSPGAGAAIGNGPGEDWSWFDYGNVRFISYPEPFSGAWSDWSGKAKTLMDAAQADANINFIVTFGHRTAYSSGHHNGNSTLKGILDGLGDGHSKYVLNVNGHSHNYERSFPQHGVTHLTVGTGGKSLEIDGSCLWLTCTQPDWSDFRAMYLGYEQLHFTKTGIQGSFICGPAVSGQNDISCSLGAVADSFTLGTPVADNVDPTVNITSPTAGASVSGTITVSANADDNIGVTGVQFRVDGANLGSQDTTAPYSSSWNTATMPNGAHTLTAIARDAAGNQATSDPVSVTVNNAAPPPGGGNAIEVRVNANSDDAEERTDTDAISLNSSDLELVLDSVNQLVGMRFNSVAIPKGATITNAYVQFKVDETGSTSTALQISGQAADNSSTFTSATGNISSRPKTGASVSWRPVAWSTVGAAGPDQRTPNLKSVIQEIVSRSGWASNNSLAVIISGTGRRTAEAFNGDQAGAPLLHVEFSTGTTTPNQAPIVDAGQNQSVTLSDSAALDGTVTDDGLPSGASLTTVWSKTSGPGTVAFADPNAVDTTVGFSVAGSYVLRLTASDGPLSSLDEVTITVTIAEDQKNQSPIVNAGPDQLITLSPGTTLLNGTVTDDGLPLGSSLTTNWRMLSGPRRVTFADPNAVDTTAGFPAAGSYVLRLTATDGQRKNFDDVTITVTAPGG
jgi:hypothetical protein